MTGSDFWAELLGLGEPAQQMSALQAAARAALIYIAVLALIRLGKKRFLGRGTAFDVIIAVVIGSVAGRAIVGGAPIGASLAAVATLIALHWLFSLAAMHSRWFGFLVKGRNRVLVRDGVIDHRAMTAEHLSLHDLQEDMREKGLEDLDRVATARIERDGKFSLIVRDEPQGAPIRTNGAGKAE